MEVANDFFDPDWLRSVVSEHQSALLQKYEAVLFTEVDEVGTRNGPAHGTPSGPAHGTPSGPAHGTPSGPAHGTTPTHHLTPRRFCFQNLRAELLRAVPILLI